MSIVFYVNGLLLAGLGVAMLMPALVDASLGNADWRNFAASALVTWAAGSFTALAARGKAEAVPTVRTAFVVTSTVWLSLSAFSALPFLGAGLDYDDAFFEAASGLTTTGSTVIAGLDTLPPGLLLWRALLQWIGGVGIVVLAIIILPFLRIGGMQLFHTESSDRSEKIVPRPLQLVRYIASIYVMLSVACATLYKLGGMSSFDAITHAMTTVSTGGFANYDASFSHFTSPWLQWSAVLFMILGALPFVAYIRAVRGERRAILEDIQISAFLRALALVSVILALWLAQQLDLAPLEALRLAAFNVVSIVTTTGYASDDYTRWGATAVGLFFVLSFVGGCSGSTSGAIKIYRLHILWLLLRAHLARLARPHRITPVSYSGRALAADVPIAILLFLAMYLASVAILTALLAFTGLDLETSFSGAITAIGNVGPGSGDIIGPAGNFTTLPDSAKWMLSAAMILGRLELFTVLLLFDPDFWRH